VIGTFTDADRLMRAVRAVRAESLRIFDVFAPYPVHGLDQAMGIRRSKLPFVTLVVGLIGLTFALTFQFYTAVFDWPLNVGGKPVNSTLAFVPICFELTVLTSGIATFVALLVRAKLYPGKREQLAAPGVTNNMFALVIRKPDAPFGVRRAREILEKSGAKEVNEKEADL
jgi:hypothetical protein